MKWPLLLAALLHLAAGAAIVDVSCPDSCACSVRDGYSVHSSCTSYEFIKKLVPKQVSVIASLSLNGSSLTSIDPKLNYLKNLNAIDLSSNDIASLPSQFPYLPKLKNLNLSANYLKEVSLAEVPKNLEVVDLSRNSITQFPKDWTSLKKLKWFSLEGNPIDCDCKNVLIYDEMLSAGVDIPKTMTCHTPKEFHGRSLSLVNCSMITDNLLNSMLSDQGSGDGAEFEVYTEDPAHIIDDEGDFIKADNTQSVSIDEGIAPTDEGSGDDALEGSGAYMIPILPIPKDDDVIPPKACHINCSTAKPVGSDDEQNASPPPDIKEQIAIIYNDLFNAGGEGSSSSAVPAEKSTETHLEVTEDTILAVTVAKDEAMVTKNDKKSQVETFPTNVTVLGEMERASSSDPLYVNIFFAALMVAVIIAIIIMKRIAKKKNQKLKNRRRNKPDENGYGEEMKPLGKSTNPTVRDGPTKPQRAPEQISLLNGQNGKIHDDSNGNAPKLLHQPVEPPIPEDDIDEDVEIRKTPTKEHLLTPQLERVTIKAGELPDSIPRTPLLIHRSLNSDGEVVTTAVHK